MNSIYNGYMEFYKGIAPSFSLKVNYFREHCSFLVKILLKVNTSFYQRAPLKVPSLFLKDVDSVAR